MCIASIDRSIDRARKQTCKKGATTHTQAHPRTGRIRKSRPACVVRLPLTSSLTFTCRLSSQHASSTQQPPPTHSDHGVPAPPARAVLDAGGAAGRMPGPRCHRKRHPGGRNGERGRGKGRGAPAAAARGDDAAAAPLGGDEGVWDGAGGACWRWCGCLCRAWKHGSLLKWYVLLSVLSPKLQAMSFLNDGAVYEGLVRRWNSRKVRAMIMWHLRGGRRSLSKQRSARTHTHTHTHRHHYHDTTVLREALRGAEAALRPLGPPPLHGEDQRAAGARALRQGQVSQSIRALAFRWKGVHLGVGIASVRSD